VRSGQKGPSGLEPRRLADEGEKGRGDDAKVDDCRALRLVAGHSTNSSVAVDRAIQTGEVELAESEQ
jgi:hypothetical protein